MIAQLFLIALITCINTSAMQQDKVFEYFTRGNVAFFIPPRDVKKELIGLPDHALKTYVEELISKGAAKESTVKFFLQHQKPIKNFIYSICPQIELEGKSPTQNSTYVKDSPKTYILNEQALDSTYTNFIGDDYFKIKVDLKDPYDAIRGAIYYQKVSVLIHKSGKTCNYLLDIGLLRALCVAVDPKNFYIYVGMHNGKILVYDGKKISGEGFTVDGKKISPIECLYYHIAPVRAIRFFYDNFLFVSKALSSDSNQVTIWHSNTRKPLLQLDSKTYGHDHLFNKVIVRSHANGWYKDLEYAIPYSWTNFESISSPEQHVYIYLLYLLQCTKNVSTDNSFGKRKKIVEYLVKKCFALGFEELVARAFMKTLQEYIAQENSLSTNLIIKQFPSLEPKYDNDPLLFNELVLSKNIQESFGGISKAVFEFVENNNVLDDVDIELQDYFTKSSMIAQACVGQVLPLYILSGCASTVEHGDLYDKNTKNKMVKNNIEVEAQVSLLADFENIRKEIETVKIEKIKVNFPPLFLACKSKQKEEAIQEIDVSELDRVNFAKLTKDRLDLTKLDRKKIDVMYWYKNFTSALYVLPDLGSSLALADKTGVVAVGLVSGAIALYDCLKQVLLITTNPAHKQAVTGIAFIRDGSCFVSHSCDSTYIWRVGASNPMIQLKHKYKDNWYVFDNCIVAAYNGYLGESDWVYELPDRLLQYQNITIKEICYLFALRRLFSQKKEAYAGSVTPALKKFISMLYNAPYNNLGSEVKMATRYFIEQKAKEFSIVLEDTTYAPIPTHLGLMPTRT